MRVRLPSVLRSRADSGDQGFLNAYFTALPGAPLFDPDAASADGDGADGADDADSSSDDAAALWRLPTRYNADVGLYVLNRRVGDARMLLLLKLARQPEQRCD
jgi:hypothetical protein